MQAFLGVESMPRTQVVKAIWDYIKANNLQVGQSNGRQLHVQQVTCSMLQGFVFAIKLLVCLRLHKVA
jgi:chromatin remodeling complex protein RSC6